MNTRLKSYKPKISVVPTLANGLLFNVSWMAIVVSHSPQIALAVVLLHLLSHFALMGRGMVEGKFVFGVTLFGFVLDQILFSSGVFIAAGTASSAPLWISCLWPVLATTFMHAFKSLQRRLPLATVIGSFGGAMSYVAGTRLSDVEFVSLFWGPLTMAIIWAVVFPALLVVARVNMERSGGD